MKVFELLRLPESSRAGSWIQNAHVALWLLKDMSWASHWHWLGMCVALPTLVLAGKIAWDSRKVMADCVHNVAVCLWICANVTWMSGEFFADDTLRPHAKVFFWLGLGLLLGYYAYVGTKRIVNDHHL